MALVRCILGKFLGVACHCFPPLSRCSQVPTRPPRRERSQQRKWELWARMLSGNFAEMTTSTPFRDLFHAANLLHGTDGFTSPPKEGVLRIFSPLKIRRLRSGLNPRTWVLKAGTLPLDHRSRFTFIYIKMKIKRKVYKTCNCATEESTGYIRGNYHQTIIIFYQSGRKILMAPNLKTIMRWKLLQHDWW